MAQNLEGMCKLRVDTLSIAKDTGYCMYTMICSGYNNIGKNNDFYYYIILLVGIGMAMFVFTQEK